MYERIKGKSGEGKRGAKRRRWRRTKQFGRLNHDFSGRTVIRSTRRYIRSMSNKATLHESERASRATIRATSSAINSSYLLTADYSYLYVFTLHIRSLPQGKSQDYEAVKNKISRLRICIAREEKYGGKKRQITRKVEPLRLSWY